jgi:hypothetical protein
VSLFDGKKLDEIGMVIAGKNETLWRVLEQFLELRRIEEANNG